jgi:hypothetical protein
MKPDLTVLLQNPLLWRGDSVAPASETIASGFAVLDELLPGNGWPKGGLSELQLEGMGIGELRLMLPALARLTADGQWVAFVAPPHIPYAPALQSADIDLSRLLLITAQDDDWWAAEQCARSGSCAAVLFWPEHCDERRLRRLQAAAEKARTWCAVYLKAAQALPASPAPLRLKLASDPESASCSLQVRILKRRGATVPAPITLDMEAAQMPGAPTTVNPAEGARGAGHVTAPLTRKPSRRTFPDFNKHYAGGGIDRNLWDCVVAHADDTLRTPFSFR